MAKKIRLMEFGKRGSGCWVGAVELATALVSSIQSACAHSCQQKSCQHPLSGHTVSCLSSGKPGFVLGSDILEEGRSRDPLCMSLAFSTGPSALSPPEEGGVMGTARGWVSFRTRTK